MMHVRNGVCVCVCVCVPDGLGVRPTAWVVRSVVRRAPELGLDQKPASLRLLLSYCLEVDPRAGCPHPLTNHRGDDACVVVVVVSDSTSGSCGCCGCSSHHALWTATNASVASLSNAS